MQNKPNLRNAKMNINFYLTRDYENKRLCQGRKNKPKQTQILTTRDTIYDIRNTNTFLIDSGRIWNYYAPMRIPLTKYGLPQVVVFPLVIIAIMAVCLFLPLHVCLICNIELILGIVLIWGLTFFRDPERVAPQDKNILLAPADGTVTDIDTVEDEYIGGQALRIGIFLSVFNVHINRTPCRVRVEKITYKKGKFNDARSGQCSKVNESNDLALVRLDEPQDRLMVRQISGAIARRIVCEAKTGDELKAGQKFGMIKFGSRTELYLPVNDNMECMVKKGDKVKAGLTVLIRYKI